VDVKNALINVAIAEGGLSKNESHRLVDNLEQDGRLLTDCWSVDDPFRRKTIYVQSSSHVIHRLERHHSSEASTGSCESTEVIDVSHVPEWPSYLRLVASGELQRRIEKATDMYSACVSCGRFCEVNRTSPDRDDWGECRVGTRAIVSAADAHFGEEACLKGTHGSGTIFFGACNLKCIYCQNWQLSAMDRGEVVTPERLAQLMLGLQERGCHNINFVSPTHNVLAILEATLIAAQNGLRLPIVWNTGGYDSVASLRLLEGVIDIYMPDAKYAARKVARKLSKIDNYPEINQAAIKEMYRQVGDLQINPRTGLAWRGLLI
jgi:putative pyruvate formate lyase activating enzyme